MLKSEIENINPARVLILKFFIIQGKYSEVTQPVHRKVTNIQILFQNSNCKKPF